MTPTEPPARYRIVVQYRNPGHPDNVRAHSCQDLNEVSGRLRRLAADPLVYKIEVFAALDVYVRDP